MKTAKKIWNIISICLIAVIVILAILVAGVRLFGVQVYTVLSGSMEPHFHTGSIIYVVETPVEELEVGDVITFDFGGKTGDVTDCTHRIMEIREEKGERVFVTKGDANNANDGRLVKASEVEGEAVFSIPYLGYLLNYIQQPPGSYIAISVAAVLLLLIIVPDIIFDDKKKKEEEQQAQTAAAVIATAEPDKEETNNEENA